MVDTKKRQTLKGITAVAGASAVGSAGLGVASAFASTDQIPVKLSTSVRQVWPPVRVRSEIKVSTRTTTRGSEVVLTNKSLQSVRITQLTPARLDTVQGYVDFGSVLSKGPVELKAGESISVSMQRHADASSVTVDGSLHNSLLGLSVVTNADVFAAVSYSNRVA